MKTEQREARRRLSAGAAPFAFALVLAGCGGAESPSSQPSPRVVFSSSVQQVIIEVDYVPGAEPYLEPLESVGNPFMLTLENLVALFAASPKDIVLPMDYGAMEPIHVPPGPYDGSALVAIADAHRDHEANDRVVSYYAVWLNGFYEKDGRVDEAVLGAALPDYGIVAMFKPAVKQVDHLFAKSLSRFTEQSAFIHEMGHVLGLVDTGLPLASDHEDGEHAGHCSNTDCVMYWANEGSENLHRFAGQIATSGERVLFDASCLTDARAAASAR